MFAAKTSRSQAKSATIQGAGGNAEGRVPLADNAGRHNGTSWDFGKVPIRAPEPARRLKPAIPPTPRRVTPGVSDSLEQEAERIAERVMNTPEADGQPGRTQTGRVQVGETGALVNPAIVDEVMRSPGQPLDSGTLGFMEPRFGCDFSSVRVHHDGAAGLSARSVNARAYTVGHNIVFGAGQFAPSTRQGRHLIAHELAHVVQQDGGVAAIQRAPGDEPRSASRAAYERYLETLREAMAKPAVKDPKLAEIVEKLYRDFPEIGSGSTAAAIRHELETGMPTKGTRHLQAGKERLNMLADWLKEQKKLQAAKHSAEALGKKAVGKAAATAAESDVRIAEHLFQDTQQAVHSGYYAEFEITVEPPHGGSGPAPSGGAKAEAAAEKAEVKLLGAEGRALGAEGKIGRLAGIGAKAGKLSVFLIEMAMPGPLDVLFLWVEFFGSLAQAKAKLREEAYALGFAEGIAARVLGFDSTEATRMLIKPITSRGSVGEQVAGFSGVREQGAIAGAVAGWKFAGGLGAKQRGGFLKEGFNAIRRKGHTIGPNFNFDDVVELGVAIKPTVDTLLEIAREQEEAARREAAAKRELEFQDAVLKYGPKE